MNLPAEARTTISSAIAKIAVDPSTKAGSVIKQICGEATIVKGAALDKLIANLYDDAEEMLAAVNE